MQNLPEARVPVSRLQLPRDIGAIRFDQKAGALAGHDFEPIRYKRDMVEKYTKRTWASDSLGATRIIRTGTSVHCTPSTLLPFTFIQTFSVSMTIGPGTSTTYSYDIVGRSLRGDQHKKHTTTLRPSKKQKTLLCCCVVHSTIPNFHFTGTRSILDQYDGRHKAFTFNSHHVLGQDFASCR